MSNLESKLKELKKLGYTFEMSVTNIGHISNDHPPRDKVIFINKNTNDFDLIKIVNGILNKEEMQTGIKILEKLQILTKI